ATMMLFTKYVPNPVTPNSFTYEPKLTVLGQKDGEAARRSGPVLTEEITIQYRGKTQKINSRRRTTQAPTHRPNRRPRSPDAIRPPGIKACVSVSARSLFLRA